MRQPQPAQRGGFEGLQDGAQQLAQGGPAGDDVIVGAEDHAALDQAGRQGVTITWREHARIGVPVTLATLGIAALWLWLAA